MAAIQQAYCKPATTDNPSSESQDTCSLPELSNQLKSENTSENTIALDAQLGQDRGIK